MKISFSFIFQSLALIILNSAMSSNLLIAQSLNVAIYNIRFDSPNDEGNLWKGRAPHLINQILFHQMDIIGTQEGFFHQLEEMKSALNYPYLGVGRNHGGEEGEFSAIFYNDKKISSINTNSAPVIFLGDFNMNEENPAYKQIENHRFFSDSRKISKLPSFGNQGTFKAFDWNNLSQDIIDHIFVSSGISVIRHGILTDNYGKKYPSDHYPVLGEVYFYN
ncbi:endonuclease/exonuclease/phosphatase family protein [Arthrospiribacter ruber]|uniref:Endonuclease/exonuclease/phosphatase domain-containing protein n=1 Tax=Arthrospiribacter ruber TaxID=2487934 RepID=A0A951J5H9_9BACT|nr:endonuclease/exonuclease/phosphatase family protein [Arthrospiribacter ruber]MBW3470341.1 hypothetical protein [Arthrospiribacter ruber]